MGQRNTELESKKILVLSTGGTIAGHLAPTNMRLLADTISHPDVELAMERIRANWDVEVDICERSIVSLDSSNMTPETWTVLVEEIVDAYDRFDGFIVTHGTNTLAYTAVALSFAIANSAKPIALTGAQIPIGLPGSDGPANVANAIRVCCHPERKFRGVITVFGSHIISGVRTKKSTEFDLDAFEPFLAGSLARIGRILDISEQQLDRHNSYLRSDVFNPAIKGDHLAVSSAFNMTGLLSLTEFPGLDVDRLMQLIDTHQISGLVFRAFGSGDVSQSLRPFFHELRNREIPAVVTTQAARGVATFQVNEGGLYLAQHGLAAASYDMSIEAMSVKLGWLLAQQLAYPEILRLMVSDLRGEISAFKEQRW